MAPAGGQAADRHDFARIGANTLVLLFLTAVALMVVLGEHLAPFPSLRFNTGPVLYPPDLAHPFGTDEFGRDVFSRVIAGARPTLVVAFASATIGVFLGTFTGLFTGYRGGIVDELIMRVMDAAMSFPALILAMLVVVMMGSNPVNVIIALGIVFWPRSARLVRSVVIDVVNREYIQAAKSRGEGLFYILARELFPNVRVIVIVDFGLRFTYGILLSASLAYLGIGVSPPMPAWGLMVRDGQQFIELAPWLVLFPCLALAVTAVGMLLVSERLRRIANLEEAERGR